ncbi:MAG: DUF1592 domain-containing protein [Bryobacterales bacterium]|nr:DUF1592 domain-containing protein [Bryobacterales bacterium]
MGCHQPNGVASTTRLVFPEPGASKDELDAFGDSLRALVDKAKPEDSVLIAKPTNRVKHAGGRRIAPGSAAETAWIGWIKHLATSEPAAQKAAAARARGDEPVLRRLTHSQYDNTVRDLIGDRSHPSKMFPPEDFIDGFKTQVHGQSISPILAEAYSAAAEKLAADWQGKDPGPAFVADFGRKAFRRPLTPEELKRYTALYQKGKARLVIEAMLQSPGFLFRLESTPVKEHQRFAKASRLSYMLWDTMPDEALMKAAVSGELDSPEGFAKHARRMLDDARARQAVDEFISQWIRFDRVLTMVKERRAYPLFTRELAVAMTEETRRLAADLVWNNKNFMDLYTANYTFLNADLAQLYSMPAPPEEFAKVNLPADSERAGILGHAAFLSLTAKPADTSITARGLFVRESFLCQQVPQPPPGVNGNLPVSTQERPMTNRERLGVHLSSPTCASCHTLIDPIGFGFEKFDGVGARREKAKVEIPSFNRKEGSKTVELALDVTGYVAGIKSSDFSTPKQLGSILAANTQCQECVVKQFFRYSMGRHENASDRPVISRIVDDFRKSGFRFQDMVVSLVKWTQFPPADLAQAADRTTGKLMARGRD